MSRRLSAPTHPADEHACEALIVEYRRLRLAAGVSLRAVAQAAEVALSGPYSFEQRRPANPLISSLVRYSTPIGYKPVLELRGVDAPPSRYSAAMAAMGFIGSACLADLIAARRHLGISKERLAAAWGLSLKAVQSLELERSEPQLRTLQGYARALGGRLDARWEAL